MALFLYGDVPLRHCSSVALLTHDSKVLPETAAGDCHDLSARSTQKNPPDFPGGKTQRDHKGHLTPLHANSHVIRTGLAPWNHFPGLRTRYGRVGWRSLQGEILAQPPGDGLRLPESVPRK